MLLPARENGGYPVPAARCGAGEPAGRPAQANGSLLSLPLRVLSNRKNILAIEKSHCAAPTRMLSCGAMDDVVPGWARIRAAALAVTACATMGAAPAPSLLKVALSSPPRPLDPAVAGAFEELAPALPAYEQLVERVGPGRFAPEIAASWRESSDGLTWRLVIAPGHRFAGGGPVDAAAVKFSFDRLLALGRAPSSDLGEIVSQVSVLGGSEVEIKLKARSARFLDLLADRSASIVDPRVARHAVNGDWGTGWLASRTAGSGAYRLAEGSDGQTYRLVRNDHWSGPRPFFDTVVYRVTPDPNVRALALARGEADVALMMPAQTLRRLRQRPGVKVESAPVLAFQNLAFNMQRPVWADVRRRRMVAAAIDTTAIVRDIRLGTAGVFYGPLAPGMIGAAPDLYRDRFDPARARRLAAAAISSPVTVVMIYPGISPETDTVAQYIQAVLAPLGVRVRLERLSVAAYTSRIQRGAYDLVLMGAVPRNDDPNAILANWFDPERIGGENAARYDNLRVTPLIKAAASERDPGRRAALHRQIASLVNADLPYVYLQQTRISHGVRSDIQGLVIDPLAAINLPLAKMRRAP